MQLAVSDTAGQRLARLFQQIDGRRAEQQKQPHPFPGLPAFVDDAAQRSEQPWRPVHLVENQQVVGVLVAVLLDVAQLGEIAWPLQVHVHGTAFVGERRLADLARPEQDNCRVSVQYLCKYNLT